MNPELKQRLIGAAVVTALATIFIPMLFDDPVDNKGQSVSELTIPAAPIKSSEVSANKMPTPANKSLKNPNLPPQEPSDTEDDPSEPPVAEAEIVDDAEAEATDATHASAAIEGEQAAVNAPEEDVPAEPLDTGVVAEAKPPVKKPTKPVKPVAEEKVIPPVVKKTEANTPKLLPATKPTTPQIIAAVKPPIKKIEVTPPKVTEKPVPATLTVPAPEKPAKNPELVRWTIHAGSFGQKENATTLMKTLREQGIPVSIETVQGGKGTIYRLKIGPELDKKKAAANKAKLDKQGVGNVMISE